MRRRFAGARNGIEAAAAARGGRFEHGAGRGARYVAGAIVASLLVAALSGCCSMSRRPIPGICAADAAHVA